MEQVCALLKVVASLEEAEEVVVTYEFLRSVYGAGDEEVPRR